MSQQASVLRLLSTFNVDAGVTLPRIREVDASSIPQPYRRLLVHDSEMTPTLEAFCGARIHLRPLRVRQDGEVLSREVTLVTDHGVSPLEFGVIHIYLERFTAAARRQILEGAVPLGTILRVQAVPHSSQPSGYFHVSHDAVIATALNVPLDSLLYGRHNRLSDRRDQLLAEVVEILGTFDSPESATPRRSGGAEPST